MTLVSFQRRDVDRPCQAEGHPTRWDDTGNLLSCSLHAELPPSTSSTSARGDLLRALRHFRQEGTK